jgi:AcrR family transcriptional regulator
LSKAQRREQLIDTALRIVRDEGADRLTLGHLAARAGVSKPIAYDHFGTRAGLLIALYTSLDEKQSDALREALSDGERSLDEVVDVLARAYVHCAVDTGGEWHAIGAALAGSEEMAAVHQELIDGYVELFAAVLTPHTALTAPALEHRCIGFVGAGEALSAAMVRGRCTEEVAADAFAAIIRGGLNDAAVD